MSEAKGFSVRIFIPSGDPEALRTVEKINWSGQGLILPRSQFEQARGRIELEGPGVYILWGPSPTGPLARVYVGEGDPVRPRLDQHARQKDFWTHAAVFTSKDQNLNKAHIQYLESRLVNLVADARRAELDNGNVPQPPSLSEADAADAEGFLGDLLLCLPVVGVSFFEKGKVTGATTGRLMLRAKGVEAFGFDGVEGFVVREGARAVLEETPSCHAYLVDLRRALVGQGVLTPDGDGYRLTQDYTFSSPSNAAGVLLGRASNGRTEWKDDTGRTLKEIQDAAIGGEV